MVQLSFSLGPIWWLGMMVFGSYEIIIYEKTRSIYKNLDRPSLDLKALCSTQHSPHELSIITLMDFKNSIKNASQESKMAFELLKKSKEASLQVRWENHIISLLLFFHSNLPTSSKYWRSKIATLSSTHCLSQYILTTETSLYTYITYTTTIHTYEPLLL